MYPDVESVNPGETVRAILSFLSPDQHLGKLNVGSPFLVREGRKVVGYGAITRLVELEASAARAKARVRLAKASGDHPPDHARSHPAAASRGRCSF
jgi:hypothetical protein